MSMHHDDQHATTASPRRRKQVVAGAIGLTAVLGAGAYLIAAQAGQDSTATTDAGAIAPIVPPTAGASSDASSASAPASVSASRSASMPAGTRRAKTTQPSASKSVSVEDEIKAARAAAEKDGHPVERPRTAAPDAFNGPVDQRDIRTANGTLRIVTARYDLTGQRELLWAADEGQPVGNARCTQNFQLSNEAEPKRRPTMMLCWRTSAGKSVLTVQVAHKGEPSATYSVGVLDKEWAKLG